MNSVIQRLKTKSLLNAEGCWIWTGSHTNAGYGRIKIKGATCSTHRVSYEQHNGAIPTGMMVCHRCDEPSCINPEHLFIATQKENLADRDAKGRSKPAIGERVKGAKLTEQKVLEILADGRTSSQIAVEYGVNRATISYIKERKTWKHIEVRV